MSKFEFLTADELINVPDTSEDRKEFLRMLLKNIEDPACIRAIDAAMSDYYSKVLVACEA